MNFNQVRFLKHGRGDFMSRNMLVHVPCGVRYYTENTRALIISAFELHLSPATLKLL